MCVQTSSTAFILVCFTTQSSARTVRPFLLSIHQMTRHVNRKFLFEVLFTQPYLGNQSQNPILPATDASFLAKSVYFETES